MSPSGEESADARDRRWAVRRGIELEGDLANAAGLIGTARIVDISEEGCRIRLAQPRDLERDALHTLKVPGLEALAGYVIWCSDGEAGMVFSLPLHHATVQNLVMKSHYARISRHMARKNGFEDRLRPRARFPFDD